MRMSKEEFMKGFASESLQSRIGGEQCPKQIKSREQTGPLSWSRN